MKYEDLVVGRKYKIGNTDCDIFKNKDRVTLVHKFNNGCVIVVDDENFDYARPVHLDLQPIEKTLDNLEVGDVLVDNYGAERTVIDVLPHSYLLSSVFNPDTIGDWYTPRDLKKDGYTIKNATPKELTELTVAEVEKKLNIPEGKLRIKKDE